MTFVQYGHLPLVRTGQPAGHFECENSSLFNLAGQI